MRETPGIEREGERQRAISRQIDRLVYEFCGLTCNADMGVAEVREFCGVADAGRGLLRAARPSWA